MGGAGNVDPRKKKLKNDLKITSKADEVEILQLKESPGRGCHNQLKAEINLRYIANGEPIMENSD